MQGNIRTFVLMAAMTALLMVLGMLLGGRGGAILALVFAGAGNLWAWWNSDKAVLRQHGIVDVSPYRGVGQNQLRISGFPSIDPEDTEALVEDATGEFPW